MNTGFKAVIANGTIERRTQLIEATIEVIWREGLSRLTLAKVARRAGLSTSIVNFYFNTKEQLLLETLQSVAAEFEQAVNRAFRVPKDPVDTLRSLVDAMLDPQLCTPARATVWYAFMGESQARDDYNATVRGRELAIRGRIEGLFVRLYQGNGPCASDPIALARAFDALIDSFWEQCMMAPDSVDLEKARRTCLGYLASVLPGEPRPDPAPDLISSEADRHPGATSNGMLSGWTYTSAELFEVEMAEIFRGQWLLVGHVADIVEPGDYLTFEAGGERAVVVRGEDNQLRAFHNVCRHRGSRVVPQSQGNCGHVLRCPFHGWTYGLDGRLKSVPRPQSFTGLDKTANGLAALELEVWNGLIFTRFEPGECSVAEQLAAINARVQCYRLADMTPLGEPYQTEVDYNWKFFHDVDNEGYHVPAAHPALQDLYGRSYRDDFIGDIAVSTATVDDHPARSWSVARYKSLLPAFPELSSESGRQWLYFGVFPNAVIYFYPEKAGYYMSVPCSPGTTRVIGREYGLPGVSRAVRAAQYLSGRIDKMTYLEDNALVQWLQEAARTSVFPLDNLSDIEAGVLRFHQRLKKEIPVMSLVHPPAPGTLVAANQAMRSGATRA